MSRAACSAWLAALSRSKAPGAMLPKSPRPSQARDETQAVLMDRTTLTRSIRPLERAGLLRVARSPQDARTKIVVITRSGERMIESIFPVWERLLKQIERSLGAEMLAELHPRLDQVIALSTVAERSESAARFSAGEREGAL
jgi:DNA-binding MarR family transcriptional regulator